MLGGASVTGIACVRWSGAGKHFALEQAILGRTYIRDSGEFLKINRIWSPDVLGPNYHTCILIVKDLKVSLSLYFCLQLVN